MRSKKAFKNILASALYQVITIICGLITPRLILSSFGSTYNGVVTSATQFLHVISILTLGITGATRLALYKPLSQNDTLGVSRIMKATKKYMRKVALCVIAYAVILCAISLNLHLIAIPPAYSAQQRCVVEFPADFSKHRASSIHDYP